MEDEATQVTPAVLPVAASGMARSFPLKTRVTAILAEPKAHQLSWPLRVSVAVVALAGLPLSAIPSPATTSAIETAAPEEFFRAPRSAQAQRFVGTVLRQRLSIAGE